MSSPQEFDELRQGDWLKGVAKISIEDFAGNARREVETPLGVAVLTQCCDLAQDYVGLVQVAPIVKLEGKEYEEARSGRTPRYAPIGGDHFADLTIIGTCTRNSPPDSRIEMSTGERQSFAECISRRFARFAFPQGIVDVLKPLKKKVRETAAKAGFIGTVFQERVVTIRLECEPDWEAPSGLSLTLLVIVKPEFLPSIDELASGEPYVATGPTQMRKQGLNGAAEAILKCDSHDQRLADAWSEFGDELLTVFQKGLDSVPTGYVVDVQVEVLRTDELHFERYRHSVDLDFDYLSTPRTETTSSESTP